MRIGVDAGCWLNRRGYGRFARELLRSMVEIAPDDRFLFFLDDETAEHFDLDGPNVKLVRVALHAPPARAAASGSNRTLLDMVRMSKAVARVRPDVTFFPSVYTFFPVVPGSRCVVAIHDVIAERHPELTLPSRRDRLLWNLKVGLARRQARLIVTVSRFSAREIEETLGITADHIRVTGEAPASAYRQAESVEAIGAAARRVGVPEGFSWFTYVGGFNPHKRLDVLIRAHARLGSKLDGEAPYLLLVGALDGDEFHEHRHELRRTVEAEGTGDRVIWTGYVSDEELRLLHAGALALVLPSEREGFGLPAVEAAACGTPVVATERSPLPDLLESAGIFVPPGDEEALAEALGFMALRQDARQAMGEIAAQRASRLTWERAARTTMEALREAAA